jgi:signal transduction histidine kinase
MAPLSLRAKLVLAYVGSALFALFLVFALGSYYINILQKRNVESSIALAEEQARQLAREVLTVVSAEQDAGGLSRQSVRDRLAPITEVVLRVNRNVVWAGVFDESGNRVIERVQPGDRRYNIQTIDSDEYKARIPTTDGSEIEVSVGTGNRGGVREITEPIRQNGRQMGEIRLRVTETPEFERIETTSRQITLALVLECVVLLLFLLGLFWVLSRLFFKQLALTQRNAQLDRMAYVGTLASGLAHEIRNPLSSMSVNLQVLREELAEAGPETRARVTELANRVEREVRQLNATLSGFLDFALPSREEISRVSLGGVVRELLDSHSEQLRQAGIETQFVSPPDAEAEVEADRRLIYQALRNVLVNAIQILATSVKKHLTVTIAASPDSFEVAVSFRDSGPGIAKESLPRLFEAFYTTRKGGTGLGLAVTKKIVEEHQGRIWAENNSDGLGACFHIVLPRRLRKS